MTLHHLDNGVEIALKEKHFANVVSIQCWVHTGSLHEEEHERGMAHFIEHMLFKGTPNRELGEIAKLIESKGGDINAYTTFDRTVFYLTLDADHFELGVDLLSDAIFNSSFEDGELAREKEVVLEEIRRSYDSPGAKINNEIFATCYQDTEAGRPVIGSEETVSSFSSEMVKKFHRKWYTPSNMSVVCVGAFETRPMLETINRYFGRYKKSPVSSISMPKHSFPDEPKVILLKDDYNLPKLKINFPAPDSDHYDTLPLDVAGFALSTGDSSRLNKKLRDEEGVAVGVSAGVYSPSFPGLFSLSAVTSDDKFLSLVERLSEESLSILTDSPIEITEIERARASLKADRAFRDETVEGTAQSLGYSITTPHKLYADGVSSALLNILKPSDINDAFRRWVKPDNAVIVAMVENDSQVTEEDILEAYKKGMKRASERKEPFSPSKVYPTKTRRSLEVTIEELRPGLKFVYQHNPEGKVFSLTGATEGGLRAELSSSAGQQNLIANMICEASLEYSHDDLVKKVENMGASLHGFSGKDSFGLATSCLAENSREMLDLYGSTFLKETFPEQQWLTLNREIQESINSQDDSPASICIRKFQSTLFGEHPYGHPIYGTSDTLGKFNLDEIKSYYSKYRNSGPWVFAAVGPKPFADARAELMDVLEGFDPQPGTRDFESTKLPIPTVESQVIKIDKDRSQTHIVYGCRGVSWKSPQREPLEILVNVLGGLGGRLFMELREKESLAYSVAPLQIQGIHGGLIGTYIACSPEKTERSIELMKKEIQRLCEEEISDQDLERSRNYIIGSHELNMQRADSRSMTMALMELYGLGYDDYIKHIERLKMVTKQDVQRVANAIFSGNDDLTVIVGS